MTTNILEYLEASALRQPDAIAFADREKSITYQELVNQSKRIASLS